MQKTIKKLIKQEKNIFKVPAHTVSDGADLLPTIQVPY